MSQSSHFNLIQYIILFQNTFWHSNTFESEVIRLLDAVCTSNLVVLTFWQMKKNIMQLVFFQVMYTVQCNYIECNINRTMRIECFLNKTNGDIISVTDNVYYIQ